MANNKQKGAQRPEDEQARVAEVETELAALPDLPPEVMTEVAGLEIPDENVTLVKLRTLWTDVKRRDAGVAKMRETYERDHKELGERRKELDSQKRELAGRETAAATRDAELANTARDLAEQRLAAEAGFADLDRASLRGIEERHAAVLQEGAEVLEKAHQEAESIVRKARDTAAQEREALQQERAELIAVRVENHARAEALELQRGLVASTEQTLQTHFERRLKLETAEVTADLEDATALLTQLQDREIKRRAELSDLQDQLSRFGSDPEALSRQLEASQASVRMLQDQLAQRPTDEDSESLRDRARRMEEAEARAVELIRERNELDRQLRYQLMAVGELEVIRDERDLLERRVLLLNEMLEQQKAAMDGLRAAESSQSPFPACTLLDRDPSQQKAASTRTPDTLEAVVTHARTRMALSHPTPYYYSQKDLRLFLAGLAGSRLHLLQGISGTGKTSLPREFFKALGGVCSIVEVQAGWRDKDDLFGYYNAFEKRFVESEFTKALYSALLPANADRLNVIVLDEMNLAHPEQYFGTMLSKLENALAGPTFLELLSSELPALPDRFEGPALPLASNVWFVGTANHDETTVNFADKTYDRAHVQVLPNSHEAFAAKRSSGSGPVSFSGLEQLFADAQRDHSADSEAAKKLLGDSLQSLFAEFGVGWGNRLMRQVESFVPVNVSAGGSVTEALDHLVATKIVRKLEDRFGIEPDDLEGLADNIASFWDLDGSPDETMLRLRKEAQRLRGGRG